MYTGKCIDGEIRIIGGDVSYEGRVQYCSDSEWGTICDGNWTAEDAAVACFQLGYPREGELNALCISFM